MVFVTSEQKQWWEFASYAEKSKEG